MNVQQTSTQHLHERVLHRLVRVVSWRPAILGVAVMIALVACRAPDTKTAEASGQRTAAEAQSSEPAEAAFVDTPANRIRVQHLSLSLTAFTLYHELGHMVIREYNIPVLGREEDAADRFATLMMTPAPSGARATPERFDPATEPDVPGVIWAAAWWRYDQRRQDAAGARQIYWDAHPLSEQRSYQILCLVYGSDPERFEAMADNYLPEERRRECPEEARANRESWARVLDGQLLAAGQVDARYNPIVEYHDAPEGLAGARQILMDNMLLEQFGANLRRLRVRPEIGRADPNLSWHLPELGRAIRERNISVVGDACPAEGGGFEINAFWDPGNRQIVLCYGLMQDFDDWATTAISRTAIGRAEANKQ